MRRLRPIAGLSGLLLCTLALGACGTTSATSTSSFSGVKREVAQTIASFQSNANSSEQSKICSQELAHGIVTRLGGAKGCEAALKTQLGEIDNPELAIASVSLSADGASASATVRSIREGKSHTDTLLLVKEAGRWKIAGL
jgi:hypothetical protein